MPDDTFYTETVALHVAAAQTAREAGNETLADRHERMAMELDEKRKVAARTAAMPNLYGPPGPGPQHRAATLGAAMREAKFDLGDRPRVVLQPEVVYRASTFPGTLDLSALQGDLVALGQDRRFLYPNLLPGPPIGTDLVIRDYRQVGTRTVTGDVERDPTETTDKAVLDVAIELALDPTRQLAVIVEGVPNAVVKSVPVFSQWLDSEMRFQIDKAADAHVIAAILAAGPTSAAVGADLVSQIRNAIAAMRDAGASPTLLAISGTDAAGLDLAVQPGTGDYIFPTRAAGAASPLYSLRVIEVTGLADPILIDPAMLGAWYTGPAEFTADPFTKFKKNLTDLRLEGPALYHIRDIGGGYVIA